MRRDETKIGSPLRDAATDPRVGDRGVAFPVERSADGRPRVTSPVPVTVDETGRVSDVDGQPAAAGPAGVEGAVLKDAAAVDPADRPPIKPESEYPERIPRVPATLVDGAQGPVWQYSISGATYFRGYQPLPVLVMHRGRNILLVEAGDES